MGRQFGELTAEEAKEIGRQGGIASGIAKREKKARKKEMAETFNTLLEMSINSGKVQSIEQIKSFANIRGKNITVNEAIAVRMMQKALNGDIRAFELIRDTIGQKPAENFNITEFKPVVIAGEGDILE